jgi:uncharacterized membrane protein YiaA
VEVRHLLPQRKGFFYGLAFFLSLFGAVAVQKKIFAMPE